MEYGYVYKTTNLLNGMLYIGQRLGTFVHYYIGSGKYLQRAIKKYGKNNFKLEVLAFATTREMLNGLEMKYIYEYRQVFGKEFLYNLSDGGGTIGYPSWAKGKTKENDDRILKIAEKLSKAKKGIKINHPESCRCFCCNRRTSLGMTGRKHSEETKQKIRSKLMGKKNALKIK